MNQSEQLQQWALDRLSQYERELTANFDDPDKVLDNAFLNGKRTAMLDLLAFLGNGVVTYQPKDGDDRR